MASVVCPKADAQLREQKYTWKSVQIHGGGFVDGVIYHPKEKDLLYCRTDMGGAYKWNAASASWQPLLDWVSYKDHNLMGVESIALDPSDPNRLYIACGTYTHSPGPNAILSSSNRGKTFKRIDVPFRMGGNENGRGNGERMAIDPAHGNIIYMGTRQDGLWKSEDRGVTWKRVDSFPIPASPAAGNPISRGMYYPQPNGIIFVLFDANRKAGSKRSVIYAGISQKGTNNIFRSIDDGLTWLPVPGQPTGLMPTHAVLSADGLLYITYSDAPGPDAVTDGAVYRYGIKQSGWKDITPIKPQPENQMGFGYAAVAIDAQHPQTIIVSTYHRYGKAGGDDIFRSTNGGGAWRPVFTGGGGGKFDYSSAPYIAYTGIHWLFDVEIDPFNSNHAIFTTGYGLHETFDLTNLDQGKPTTWTVMNNGIEETVGLDILSPPKGAQLISGIGDYGGFVHHCLDKPVPAEELSGPRFSNTTSISCAAQNSDVMVETGEGSGSTIKYSLDGGETWRATQNIPDATSKSGSVSVSASGREWIWTPQQSPSYLTADNGATWQPISSLPANQRVVADPVNPEKFYSMALFHGKLYTSTDCGHTFVAHDLQLQDGLPQRVNRGDIRGGQDRLYMAPDREGDLWIAAFDGLYHIKSCSYEFAKLDQVSEIHAFGFGRAAPGGDYPTLFLVGTISGKDGVFRSDDDGKHWVCINDEQHRWGLILQITGDPKKYGRVYVGTHGRGIFYGDIH
ncbi:galactose oxidase [Mucilaginibacter sp. PPCGB 2223]|nr:galactose oxidase [Mucilaginibacter sp. PPCGB 2223]